MYNNVCAGFVCFLPALRFVSNLDTQITLLIDTVSGSPLFLSDNVSRVYLHDLMTCNATTWYNLYYRVSGSVLCIRLYTGDEDGREGVCINEALVRKGVVLKHKNSQARLVHDSLQPG